MNTAESSVLILIVTVLVCIGVFFLMRSLLLWYWKIDKIVDKLDHQILLLNKQQACLEKLSGYGLPASTESPEELAHKAKLYDQRQKAPGANL